MHRQTIHIGRRCACVWTGHTSSVRFRKQSAMNFSNASSNQPFHSNSSNTFHYRSSEYMDKAAIFSWLNLHTFSTDEISDVTNKLVRYSKEEDERRNQSNTGSIDNDKQYLSEHGIKVHLLKRIRTRIRRRDTNLKIIDRETTDIIEDYAKDQARALLRSFKTQATINDSSHEYTLSTSTQISRDDFEAKLKDMASTVEYKKILPITMSMIMIGSSVGIITPVMPSIVAKLGLTASEFGMVASSFAAAKMVGNFPAAVLVERHGRKPYLVYSLSLVAIGVGGIGLATNMEELILCRLITGVGVAALSTASNMMVTDISTTLNRASTFAPIMSGFAAGTALGPAIGGLLADRIGVEPTFFVVGASFFGLTLINKMLLSETKSGPFHFPWEVKDEIEPDTNKTSTMSEINNALAQWSPLMSIRQVRNVVILNGMYWFSLSGAQMTCLPLILTDISGPFAMTATSVGQVYMGMSVMQFMTNPIIAKIADKVGKFKVIISGGSILSLSILAMSLSTDIYELAAAMSFWTLGSTMLSTAPVAHVSDLVSPKGRAQAIALLRTSGDIGFFLGASSIGMIGDFTGDLSTAMQTGAGLLFAGTAWFGARQFLIHHQSNK